MPIPAAIAIGAGLLKGGLSLFSQLEQRKAARKRKRDIANVISDIEEQEVRSASQAQARLNTILSRAAMEKDPRKSGIFAQMFAGTTQAREAEKQRLETQKRQLELQQPIVPDINIVDILGNIATGALSGAELGLNIQELRKDIGFRDKMRDFFLSELDLDDTPEVAGTSPSTLIGAGLQANQRTGLGGLTQPDITTLPFFGRGFVEPF